MILKATNTTSNAKALSAKFKDQFTEVDEAYFRQALSQKSLQATERVFSVGCITYMANQSFCITAAVQRPQAASVHTDETAPKVTYLLPVKTKVLVPISLRLKFYAARLNKPALAFTLHPLATLFALPRQAMSKLVSSHTNEHQKPENNPEWHTLRLTTSELST